MCKWLCLSSGTTCRSNLPVCWYFTACKECMSHRQSKVEGEHWKDTALAAVLISWITAQVIYRGRRLLQLLSWDGLAEAIQQYMTDVPCFYVNPPEVTVASVPRVRQQKQQQRCSSMDVDMQTWRGSCSSKEGAGQRGRKRETGRAVKLCRRQGDSSKGQLCSGEKKIRTKSTHTCIAVFWNRYLITGTFPGSTKTTHHVLDAAKLVNCHTLQVYVCMSSVWEMVFLCVAPF